MLGKRLEKVSFLCYNISMSKGLLTKYNSQLNEIVKYYEPNESRHSIHFESEDLKDVWISRYLYGEENYDFKQELENQPEFAFIQNSALEGMLTIKLSYYQNNWGETVNSLLNKDTAIVKVDANTYYLYNLTNATNEGEENISYKATLNIPFSLQILGLLKNDFLIKRTHATTDFINLDSEKNDNNIWANFNKREMFDYTSLESKENINIPSIFLFYQIESGDDGIPSQNSLHKVKIIPICTGEYYPNGEIAGNSMNTTINALNEIYKEKDPLLQYIKILPETPYITKNLKTINGEVTWDGELNYNINYLTYENKNYTYIFTLNSNSIEPTNTIIFKGIYKLDTRFNTGEFEPKIINFYEEIDITKPYQFDYGAVYNPADRDSIQHIYYTLLGSYLPKLNEETIIFFPGLNNEKTINIVFNLNNKKYEDAHNRELYNIYVNIPEDQKVAIFPIKITNIDNINYKFETPTGNDIYELYDDTWYYVYDVSEAPNKNMDKTDKLWGISSDTIDFRIDSQIVFKELIKFEPVSSSTYNFAYRFNLKNFIQNEEDIHLFQSGTKNLIVGIPNTDFSIKVPINYLNQDYLYIIGVLDLYKMTCNYFLSLSSYNINSQESNFTVENVQLDGPTISSNYQEWYNANKISRALKITSSSILLAGGIGGGLFHHLLNPFAGGKGLAIGGGLALGGAARGLRLLANKGNLEHSPAKVKDGENLFINFIQPYITYFTDIAKEDKIANFDFSLYIWEERPENNYQENKKNELKMFGIEVSNLANSYHYFGEKKTYQYYEILETFENIQAPIAVEIKQRIDEIFEGGITFWYYRADRVWGGIKNYEQENPFIDIIE